MVEAVDIQQQLQEKWIVMWWALGIGLVNLGIAWLKGAFHPFHVSAYPIIRGQDVLKGFTYFIVIEMVLIPAAFSVLAVDVTHLDERTKGVLQLIMMIGGSLGVFMAYKELTHEQRRQLWQQTEVPWYEHVKVGIIAWIICYPFVVAFSQALSLATWYLFHHTAIEQVAVQNLRQVMMHPWIFGFMALAVVTIVPFTEEYLFRGLLQNWLKRRLHHPAIAIVLSSFVFALFHYSTTQGLTNFELLSSLFLLGCVLGFIYERQRSLWASISLHSFFNLMSLGLIFIESSQA